jgi:hypothetical protein
MQAVLSLNGEARYRHFIKQIVDAESAWGLWDDGWALMQDESGVEIFPLWPAKEYAQAACVNQWSNYVPETIDLDDLVNDLLPKLAQKGMLPGIFPTTVDKATTPSIDELLRSIKEERAKYGE